MSIVSGRPYRLAGDPARSYDAAASPVVNSEQQGTGVG